MNISLVLMLSANTLSPCELAVPQAQYQSGTDFSYAHSGVPECKHLKPT
jgi:hypothetical protein